MPITLITFSFTFTTKQTILVQLRSCSLRISKIVDNCKLILVTTTLMWHLWIFWLNERKPWLSKKTDIEYQTLLLQPKYRYVRVHCTKLIPVCKRSVSGRCMWSHPHILCAHSYSTHKQTDVVSQGATVNGLHWSATTSFVGTRGVTFTICTSEIN